MVHYSLPKILILQVVSLDQHFLVQLMKRLLLMDEIAFMELVEC